MAKGKSRSAPRPRAAAPATYRATWDIPTPDGIPEPGRTRGAFAEVVDEVLLSLIPIWATFPRGTMRLELEARDPGTELAPAIKGQVAAQLAETLGGLQKEPGRIVRLAEFSHPELGSYVLDGRFTLVVANDKARDTQDTSGYPPDVGATVRERERISEGQDKEATPGEDQADTEATSGLPRRLRSLVRRLEAKHATAQARLAESLAMELNAILSDPAQREALVPRAFAREVSTALARLGLTLVVGDTPCQLQARSVRGEEAVLVLAPWAEMDDQAALLVESLPLRLADVGAVGLVPSVPGYMPDEQFVAAARDRLVEGMRSRPHESFVDKQELVKWANAELRAGRLAMRCPVSHKPSILVAGPDKTGQGRFLVQHRNEEGGQVRSFSTKQLDVLIANLELMPAERDKGQWGRWLDARESFPSDRHR